MKTKLTFKSGAFQLSAILFRPDHFDPVPAIVISNPGGAVKEQASSLYAERLAAKGFAVLVFDNAYQGESTGEPRGLEDPFQRAEDIRNAVSYLTSRPDIDSQRIGAMGICASGGYVLYTAQTDLRIKAVATISATELAGLLFPTDEMRQSLLKQAGEQRNSAARGLGEFLQNYVPADRTTAESFPERTLFREAYEYYRTPRGAHPNSTQWGIIRTDIAAQFDAFRHNDWISPRPVLAIVGSEAETIHFSEQAIAKAQEPKELYSIQGASHVDLYDQDPFVEQCVEKLAQFFMTMQ